LIHIMSAMRKYSKAVFRMTRAWSGVNALDITNKLFPTNYRLSSQPNGCAASGILAIGW